MTFQLQNKVRNHFFLNFPYEEKMPRLAVLILIGGIYMIYGVSLPWEYKGYDSFPAFFFGASPSGIIILFGFYDYLKLNILACQDWKVMM